MMAIEHEDNGISGRFYVKQGDVYQAQMVYTWTGNDKIVIQHTEVDEVLQGQGVAMHMLTELVTWARAKHLQIIPVCPFAKKVMEKDVEKYKDVLYHA